VLRLYDYGPSANCYKVRLALGQLGIPYEKVPVDIFAGETLTPEYLAKNPSGRTPVLELDSGECLAESNAIVVYLVEGTSLMPTDAIERARVWQWLFFEQNLLEPNLGTAAFWNKTGRATQRPQVYAQRLEAARAALELIERQLDGRRFLVGDRYTAADLCVYAYAHKAGEADIDLASYPAVAAWIGRVEKQPGFFDDLEPYRPNAMAGAGDSVHD
jgi:glutathione S-transferase